MLHDFSGLLEEDEITYSWFQQDGATAHTANNSMKLLNEIFGERVISRNVWPPCSPELTPSDFYLWGAAKSAVYRDRPRTLNELNTAITAYIRNISQADMQKVFANKIKRVQSCIDARGHHFQQHLQAHSNFPNADLQKVFANKIKQFQVCIDARGHHFQHLL
jgi:hypothetical protein